MEAAATARRGGRGSAGDTDAPNVTAAPAAPPVEPTAAPPLQRTAALVSLPLRYPVRETVRRVDVWVAQDARTRELRAALTVALRLPDDAPLKLWRDDGSGRLVSCALSAGLLLAEAPSLVLDAGYAPRSPSWWHVHAPQLCALVCFSALYALPQPLAALCLLPLAVAAAAVQPGGGPLLRRTLPVASAFFTAYVFSVIQSHLLPPPVALVGFLVASAGAIMQARALLVSTVIMVVQLLLARLLILNSRFTSRKAQAAK